MDANNMDTGDRNTSQDMIERVFDENQRTETDAQVKIDNN